MIVERNSEGRYLGRKELGGGGGGGTGAGDRRRKRRKGRVWVAPLCGSFCCPSLSPIKASQHKLKVTFTFLHPNSNTLTYLLCSYSSLFSIFSSLLHLFSHLFIISLILSQSHMSDFQQCAPIFELNNLDGQAKERAGAQWTQACVSSPSLNLHTWVGTRGQTLTQLRFSLQTVSSQGV